MAEAQVALVPCYTIPSTDTWVVDLVCELQWGQVVDFRDFGYFARCAALPANVPDPHNQRRTCASGSGLRIAIKSSGVVDVVCEIERWQVSQKWVVNPMPPSPCAHWVYDPANYLFPRIESSWCTESNAANPSGTTSQQCAESQSSVGRVWVRVTQIGREVKCFACNSASSIPFGALMISACRAC